MIQRLTTIGSSVLAFAVAGTPVFVGGAIFCGGTERASAQFEEEDATTIRMKRETLAKLMRPVTVDLQDHRLEDVVEFISDVTQADITPLWIDDRRPVGLDPEATVTLSVKDVSALSLLEMTLDKLGGVDYDEATWQFTKYGSFVFGPKERLNSWTRVELYDINDMLMEIPDYDNAPDFDLNTVFQAGGQTGGGGGGGGQSPFQQGDLDIDRVPREEKVQDIIDLIITTVEPEQWIDNGGEAATIRELRGTLFVNAPDYVHRQLNGYDWWPARAQRVTYSEGRRYVTLDGTYDFAEAEIDTAIDIDAVP